MRWKSLKGRSPEDRFWEKVTKRGATMPHMNSCCWEWMGGKDGKGYGSIGINGRSIKAHRYAWQLANGRKPGKSHVLHRCDNPGCVRPDHLYLGSNLDNIKDKVRRNRTRRGENHPQSKLTAEDVKEIRQLYKSGKYTQYQLADDFNVSQTQIKDIINKRKWAWL